MNAFRLPKSLLGFVAAFGLSLGVFAGTNHDHELHDHEGEHEHVCVLAAGHAVSSSDGEASGLVELPAVALVERAAPTSIKPPAPVRSALARGPPSSEAVLG